MADPLESIMKNDPELFKAIGRGREFAIKEGAIPLKYKILIAMALDASHGAENGVRSLAKQALQNDATKEEILEAVRIAGYICGVGSIYTASLGLSDVL